MIKIFFFLIITAVALLVTSYFLANSFNAKTQAQIFERSIPMLTKIQTPTPTPTPKPTPIVLKQALPRDAYTIILVGDSMTESLGPNTNKLREYLEVNYPSKVFGINNLGEGSTNILSVQEKLEKDILPSREFEVIIIESFGYNPLSDLTLEEGLKKQTETLDKIVSSIREAKSKAKVNSIIVFLATIAPNWDNYGKGAVNLSAEERRKWADERSAYINNHIQYAKSHDIPLINVYEKSLNAQGTGSLDYIEGATFIHPNEKGIELISKEIADFLFNNKILLP